MPRWWGSNFEMVQLTEVEKSFRVGRGMTITPVRIVAFHVVEGERIALKGPSGTGKTTLLHLVSGVLRPTGGSVEVAGASISEMPEAERDRFRARHIGYVFQSFHLVPSLSAIENVMLPLRFSRKVPSGAQRPRARRLLERVGLAARLDHKPHQLSSGEAQRVAVARALANEPQLLLADEPTAHLDAKNAESVMELILGLCEEEGLTLLLTTHDPRLRKGMREVSIFEINEAARNDGGDQ